MPPKLSVEAFLGLLIEVVVVILDHLHVRNSFIIWLFFGIGLLLLLDAVIRSDWALEKVGRERRNRRVWASVPIVVLGLVIGTWIYNRSKQIESGGEDKKELSSQGTAPTEAKTKVDNQQPPTKAQSEAVPSEKVRNYSTRRSAVAAVPQIIQAPHGIAIGGGTVANPTVNNYGVQSRVLDDMTVSTLADKLSAHQSVVRIDIENPSGDSEPYANRLLLAFGRGHWTTQGVNKAIHGTDIGADGLPVPIPTGLHIYSRSGRDDPLALFVEQTIKSVGVACHPVEKEATLDSGIIRLFVGDAE